MSCSGRGGGSVSHPQLLTFMRLHSGDPFSGAGAILVQDREPCPWAP